MKYNTPTRLEVGHIILFNGEKHEVVRVNDCCARVVPLAKRKVEIKPETGKEAGNKISFSRSERGFNISPDSECPIVGRMPKTVPDSESQQ